MASEGEPNKDDLLDKAEESPPPESATPESVTPSSVVTAESKTSVVILLRSTANAPIMKKRKWTLDRKKPVGWIIDFISKYIKCEPHESLFLYVNQAFAPAPDVEIGTIYDCFGSDGKLVLHYCKTPAWG